MYINFMVNKSFYNIKTYTPLRIRCISMTKKYNVVVVSHTHWDREWYLPFQGFRIRLVKLIDKLLGILEENPQFRNFTLDGQTIVVEDYLEIRPEREEAFRKFVSKGKMLMGPWYVLPDEFLVSGESIIRNLMLGHRIAENFGGIMKVGYIPDPFGHISQIPQILKGFGIGSCVFWRGLDDEGKRLPTEFYWQAPDGSSVFTVHLRTTYCNAHSLPEKADEALNRIKKLIRILAPIASTSNILLMNGCDHLEPQPFLPRLIEEMNKKLNDTKLVQGTLVDYLQRVQSEEPDLPTITGEQRSNKYGPLLPGVVSARIYLKQKNVETQTLLERWAEPFSTFVWTLGGDYPSAFLWRAWKHLLQNHPHDSICGCSIDEVHRENLTRFTWCQQIANEIINQSLRPISESIKTKEQAQTYLVVFNPLGWTSTGVARAKLRIPPEMGGFSIRDFEGKAVPFQILERRKDETEILFLAENVPMCGYKTYGVHPSEVTEALTSLKVSENIMENEFLKVKINANGALTITDKRTGRIYRNVNVFEDSGDAGDEYNYSPPKEDKVITSGKDRASVRLLARGPVAATFRVDLRMALPKELVKSRERRSAKETVCPITSFVTLYPKIPRVDIKTVVQNNAKDHRLRVLFPTGLKTEFSYAEEHFDVVKRPVKPLRIEASEEIINFMKDAGWWTDLPEKPERWIEDPPSTHPHQTFVDINDGKTGVAVMNKGLPEYEVLEGEEGVTIALTLLRCVGWLSRPDLAVRRGNAGPMIPTPEAQCPGRHVFKYAITPHEGTWENSRAYHSAHQFNVSFRTQQTGKHEGSLPETLSFISIEPENLVLSAVKKAEREKALIIRFYNITEKRTRGKIRLYRPIAGAEIVDLNEESTNHSLKVASDGCIPIDVGPKRIISVKVTF